MSCAAQLEIRLAEEVSNGADAAGLVLGAAIPFILTSRADSVRTRLAYSAVGALYAHHLLQQKQEPTS